MKLVNNCYFSLAFSAFSMFLACFSLQNFSINDRISVKRGIFLTSLGFVYFVSLTDFFNKFFLETSNGLKIRKHFRLKLSDVLEINNKIVSAVQALLSSLAGAIVCRYSCTISFLHASHFITEAYAYFGAAYFIYDIWSMYKVHAATTAQKIADKLKSVTGTDTNKEEKINTNNGRLYDKHCYGDSLLLENNKNKEEENFINNNEKQILSDYEISQVETNGKDFAIYMISNPVMMVHHIFLGSFGLAVIAYLRGGLGDCIFSHIYMMEISTPFVSLRSILSRMNLKKSKFYIVNGLTMLVTFFLFRVLMLPYLFYYYSQVANVTLIHGILSLPRSCKIGIAILFLPQYYWFYLMVAGALKAFFPKNKQKKSNQKSQQDNGIDTKLIINDNNSMIDNNYITTDINTTKKQL